MSRRHPHLPKPYRPLGRGFVRSRAIALLRHPLFHFLTLVGNGFVVLGATALYWLEKGTNPRLETIIDALWWAVATVTTVGYGDVFPVTPPGKIMGMFLMLFGTALFSSFTALFASILLEPELEEVEDEVRDLEAAVHRSEKRPP